MNNFTIGVIDNNESNVLNINDLFSYNVVKCCSIGRTYYGLIKSAIKFIYTGIEHYDQCSNRSLGVVLYYIDIERSDITLGVSSKTMMFSSDSINGLVLHHENYNDGDKKILRIIVASYVEEAQHRFVAGDTSMVFQLDSKFEIHVIDTSSAMDMSILDMTQTIKTATFGSGEMTYNSESSSNVVFDDFKTTNTGLMNNIVACMKYGMAVIHNLDMIDMLRYVTFDRFPEFSRPISIIQMRPMSVYKKVIIKDKAITRKSNVIKFNASGKML